MPPKKAKSKPKLKKSERTKKIQKLKASIGEYEDKVATWLSWREFLLLDTDFVKDKHTKLCVFEDKSLHSTKKPVADDQPLSNLSIGVWKSTTLRSHFSSFNVYSQMRLQILGEKLAMSLADDQDYKSDKATLEELEKQNEEEEKKGRSDADNIVAEGLPRTVELGVIAIFEFLKDAALISPELCVNAFWLLQKTLDGFAPQALSKQSSSTLKSIASLCFDVIMSASSPVALRQAAISTYLTLSVAWGSAFEFLSIVKLLLQSCNEGELEDLYLPNNLLALVQRVTTFGVEPSLLPTSAKKINSFSLPTAAEPSANKGSCITTDGSYLYILHASCLSKVGTGLFGTTAGNVYASVPNFCDESTVSMACVGDKLYFRSQSTAAGMLRILSCADLSDQGLAVQNVDDRTEEAKTSEDEPTVQSKKQRAIGTAPFTMFSTDKGYLAVIEQLPASGHLVYREYLVDDQMELKQIRATPLSHAPFATDAAMAVFSGASSTDVTYMDTPVVATDGELGSVVVPAVVSALAANSKTALYVTAEGDLAWSGSGDIFGMANVSSTSIQTLDNVAQKIKFAALGHDSLHGLLIAQGGELLGVGSGADGAFGSDKVKFSKLPNVLSPLAEHKFKSAAVSKAESGAITTQGLVYTWGNGAKPSLLKQFHGTAVAADNKAADDGVKDDDDEDDAAKVKRKARSISFGVEHGVIVSTDGEVWCKGSNTHGQLGLADKGKRISKWKHVPIQAVDAEDSVVDVVCGHLYTVLLTAKGKVIVFGQNANGQLGISNREDVVEPVVVTALKDTKAVEVAAGADRTLIRSDNGVVWCLGGLSAAKEDEDKPTVAQLALPNDKRVAAVAVGESKSLLLLSPSPLSPTDLSNSSVFSSKSGVVLMLPAEAKLSDAQKSNHRLCRIFNSKSGRFMSDLILSQVDSAISSVAHDFNNNCLWAFSAGKGEVTRFQPHASTGQKTAILNGSLILNDTQYTLPASAVKYKMGPTHIPMNLLSLLDQADVWIENSKSDDEVVEKQKSVSLLSTVKSVVGETHQLVRYESVQNQGWYFGGIASSDCVSFEVDTSIEVVGIGVFGGQEKFQGEVFITEGNCAADTRVEGGQFEIPVMADGSITEVPFDAPALLVPGTRYTLCQKTTGTNGWYGERASKQMTGDGGVSFEFFNSTEPNNNGTNDNRGQLGSIFYRLPRKDVRLVDAEADEDAEEGEESAVKTSNASAIGSRKPVTNDPASVQSFSVRPRALCCGFDLHGFQGLVETLQWSVDHLLQISHLDEKDDMELIERKKCLCFLMLTCLRLLRRNLSDDAHRDQWKKNKFEREQGYAVFLWNISNLLKSIFSSIENPVLTGTTSTSAYMDIVAQECTQTFKTCFSILYPTWNLKKNCLKELLLEQQALEERNQPPSPALERALFAVLDTISEQPGATSICFPELTNKKKNAKEEDEDEDDETRKQQAKQEQAQAEQNAIIEATLLQLIENERSNNSVAHAKATTMPDHEFILSRLLTLVTSCSTTKDTAYIPHFVPSVSRLLATIQSQLVDATLGPALVPAAASKSRKRSYNTAVRFDSVSNGWSYGGSPDSICFTVDKKIMMEGVHMYGSGSNSSYKVVVTLYEGDSLNDMVTKAEQDYTAEDLAAPYAPVLFDSSVVIQPDTKYLIHTVVTGPSSYYGNIGKAEVECNGVKFVFSDSSNSSNGTGNASGQIQGVLWRKAAESVPVDLSKVPEEGSLLKNEKQATPFLTFTRQVFDKVETLTMDLLSRKDNPTSGQPGNVYTDILSKHPALHELLPVFLLRLTPIIVNERKLAEQLLPSLSQLLEAIDKFNRSAKGNETPCAAHHVVRVESDHPYVSAAHKIWNVSFPESVEFMMIEFDSKCDTLQDEDKLVIYTDRGKDMRVHGEFAGPAVGEDVAWPKQPLFVPGNQLSFDFSTMTPTEKKETLPFGFACSVTGFDLAKRAEFPLHALELELAHAVGICLSVLLKPRAALSKQKSSIRELLCSEAFKMGFEPVEVVSLGLPSKSTTEREFLKDFVAASEGTDGGRLAKFFDEFDANRLAFAKNEKERLEKERVEKEQKEKEAKEKEEKDKAQQEKEKKDAEATIKQNEPQNGDDSVSDAAPAVAADPITEAASEPSAEAAAVAKSDVATPDDAVVSAVAETVKEDAKKDSKEEDPEAAVGSDGNGVSEFFGDLFQIVDFVDFSAAAAGGGGDATAAKSTAESVSATKTSPFDLNMLEQLSADVRRAFRAGFASLLWCHDVVQDAMATSISIRILSKRKGDQPASDAHLFSPSHAHTHARGNDMLAAAGDAAPSSGATRKVEEEAMRLPKTITALWSEYLLKMAPYISGTQDSSKTQEKKKKKKSKSKAKKADASDDDEEAEEEEGVAEDGSSTDSDAESSESEDDEIEYDPVVARKIRIKLDKKRAVNVSIDKENPFLVSVTQETGFICSTKAISAETDSFGMKSKKKAKGKKKLEASYYYEVKILNSNPDKVCCIGLLPSTVGIYAGHLGWSDNSLAYHGDDGQFYGSGAAKGSLFGAGDVVGVGWKKSSKQVFFTLNGEMLGVKYQPERVHAEAYHAAITASTGTKFYVNLGQSPFEYDSEEKKRKTRIALLMKGKGEVDKSDDAEDEDAKEEGSAEADKTDEIVEDLTPEQRATRVEGLAELLLELRRPSSVAKPTTPRDDSAFVSIQRFNTTALVSPSLPTFPGRTRSSYSTVGVPALGDRPSALPTFGRANSEMSPNQNAVVSSNELLAPSRALSKLAASVKTATTEIKDEEGAKDGKNMTFVNADIFSLLTASFTAEQIRNTITEQSEEVNHLTMAVGTATALLSNLHFSVAVHELLWFIAAALHVNAKVQSEDENRDKDEADKEKDGNNNNTASNTISVAQHFLSIVGPCCSMLKTPVQEAFYQLLGTLSSTLTTLRDDSSRSSIQLLALRCWSMEFKEEDHTFILDSQILANIRQMMSIASAQRSKSDAEKTSSVVEETGGQATCLLEITNKATLTASSQPDRLASLLDNSTDTVWETSFEDENKWKWIRMKFKDEDAAILQEVSVFVANDRDKENGVKEIKIEVGPSDDKLKQTDSVQLHSSFTGWVSLKICMVSADKATRVNLPNIVSIKLSSSGKTTRVRGLRAYANEAASRDEKQAEKERKKTSKEQEKKVETEALRVFKVLSSQVFSQLMSVKDEKKEDEAKEKADNVDKDKKEPALPDLRKQRSSAFAGLREHLAGVLFAEDQGRLSGLQQQLFELICAEIQSETAKYQTSKHWLKAAVGAPKPADGEAEDVYCFELISILLSLSGSSVGKRFVATKHIMATLFSLFSAATPRIQRQIISIWSRVLPETAANKFDGQTWGATVPASVTGVLPMLLLLLGKALDLTLRAPGFKASQPGQDVDKYAEIDTWLPGARLETEVAAKLLACLKELRNKSLWKNTFDRLLNENIHTLANSLKDLAGSPLDCTKMPRVWLALASMAVVGQDHASLANVIASDRKDASPSAEDGASTEADKELSKAVPPKAAGPTAMREEVHLCENHDDGKTVADWTCETCEGLQYLCHDCDHFIHLRKSMQSHKRTAIERHEEEEPPTLDFHAGCSRLKATWLVVLVDVNRFKAVVEFRKEGARRTTQVANGALSPSTTSTPSARATAENCRFCGVPVTFANRSASVAETPALASVCNDPDCQAKTEISCVNTLPCGHYCGGVRNESICLPCFRCTGKTDSLSGHAHRVTEEERKEQDTEVAPEPKPELSQDADDYCMVCWTENLGSAPAIQLGCGHVFHYACIRKSLELRWNGPRITFGFCKCPLCKTDIEHEMLEDVLGPIKALREEVKMKAQMRARYEGLDEDPDVVNETGRFYKDLAGLAMDRFAYYLCYKCNHAYFGGERVCQAAAGDVKYDPTELICAQCSPISPETDCPKHGREFLDFKCRFCCSVSVFFCFGTTHFCDACHGDPSKMTGMGKADMPKCPAGPLGQQLEGDCPLGMKHPPTGEEFVLGCGICRNARTF